MRECIKCGSLKDESEFRFCKGSFRKQCKECNNIENRLAKKFKYDNDPVYRQECLDKQKKLRSENYYKNGYYKNNKAKINEKANQQNRDTKNKLVNIKGSKCEICGYNKCIAALDFHHRDPNTKEMELSSAKITSKEKFDMAVKELEKCILVCSNCHREIHYLEKLNPPNIKGDIKEIT